MVDFSKFKPILEPESLEQVEQKKRFIAREIKIFEEYYQCLCSLAAELRKNTISKTIYKCPLCEKEVGELVRHHYSYRFYKRERGGEIE